MGIKNFQPRLYQQTIFATCTKHNTLVALPTGLGKTAICAMLAAHRLSLYPQSKIIVLAPTRPLIDQHYKTFENYLDVPNFNEKSEVLSGTTEPGKRTQEWTEKQLVFATPQTLQNDLISGKANLRDVSLLCFDEAHRAVGDYSYVYIAKQYMKQGKFPRILALTASPGSDMEQIKELIANLFIEKIEVRTDKDKDVEPYIQEVTTEWVEVELPPELRIIHKYLLSCLKSKIEELKKYGYAKEARHFSRSELLGMQAQLQGLLAQGDKSFEVLKSLSVAAEAMKVEHALELVETQGISPLLEYFGVLFEQSRLKKSKAVQNLVQDINFKTAYMKAQGFSSEHEHPKLVKLRQVVQKEIDNNPGVKMIVFSHYRDMASRIFDELVLVDGAKPAVFVGQTKKKGDGMSQKEQIRVLDEFREGNYNILISTSVGEEGLDIPQVDLVVFYEPVPSAIRKIQRQGRTGRLEKGRVIVLITKDTRDVGYRWSAHHKEGRMYRSIKQIKDDLGQVNVQMPKLTDFMSNEEKMKIYVDTREKGSKKIEILADEGFLVELKRLDTADYVLSKDVGVEFKTIQDFADSIVDGRLLSQLRELKKNYPKPLIIVEGEQDLYSARNLNPNAIKGMLATIVSSYNIPILFTKNEKETAQFLAMIARREQEEKKDFSPHSQKPKTQREIQEYVVSSLPNVGGSLSRELLRQFKTIKAIVNASEEELKKVENMGDKKAKQIKELVEKDYLEG